MPMEGPNLQTQLPAFSNFREFQDNLYNFDIFILKTALVFAPGMW